MKATAEWQQPGGIDKALLAEVLHDEKELHLMQNIVQNEQLCSPGLNTIRVSHWND